MPFFDFQGHSVFFEDAGVGGVLLILPGNTSASGNFEEQVRILARRHRVIVLDYPGVGRSDRLERWPDDWWEQNFRCAVALLDHLSIARFIPIGTSSGAAISLELARHFPDRAAAAVADSYAPFVDGRYIQTMLFFRNNPSEELRHFWLAAHGADWEDVIAKDNDLLRRIARRGAGWQRTGLDGIACPVLLSGSLHDTMYPNLDQILARLARQHGNCEVATLRKGGHTLMLTCPFEFCETFQSFLGKHPGLI